MARITVEECLANVGNRFDLVLLASRRARQLATGGKEPLVEFKNDKPTVLALREIEAGLITQQKLDAAERAEEAEKDAHEAASVAAAIAAGHR